MRTSNKRGNGRKQQRSLAQVCRADACHECACCHKPVVGAQHGRAEPVVALRVVHMAAGIVARVTAMAVRR